MTTRLEALQDGMLLYDGVCLKHGNIKRWTGSGKCSTCHPKKRGTLIMAMEALYGRYDVTLQRAEEDELPCFKATCKHGHTSWRYVKTPHICLQCVAAARGPRKERPAPPVTLRHKAPRKWYYVADLKSGLIVSPIYTSSTVAATVRREIKRDHPTLNLIVMVRRQTEKSKREIEAAPMLRLDRYPHYPFGPSYSKY